MCKCRFCIKTEVVITTSALSTHFRNCSNLTFGSKHKVVSIEKKFQGYNVVRVKDASGKVITITGNTFKFAID